jgi:squalene cyclase
MTSIDLDRALIYIDENGNVQDKARLLYILMQESPPDYIVRPLLDKQNPDGGFPSRPRTENPSSVDNTLTALWQLNELGMLGTLEAQRALDFLFSTQMVDGGWDENPALPEHDLPPWIKPGQVATRNYLSAYAAFWLGIAARTQQDTFQRAATYLTLQQEPGGKIPGYQHGQWIGTSVFFLGGDAFSLPAQSGLSILDQIPLTAWEDSQIAWATDCLGMAGVPAENAFIHKMLPELASRQEANGSWSSEDGPAYAVSATISTIKALKRFGWIESID